MENTLLKWFELFTIFFGLFCIGVSIILAYKFKKVDGPLPKALSLQLLAEGFIGLITVIFALASWVNLYAYLSPIIVLCLRLIIFTTAAMTSINLYKTVSKIEKG